MKDNLSKLSNDKGVTAIIVALLLVVLLGIAALAIDVGFMAMTKNESQNAADAAALAGARQLGENYANTLEDLTANVTSVAQNIAKMNKVAGLNLAVDNIIPEYGDWDRNNNKLIVTSVSPSAVCAEVKREEGRSNGPINTFLAQIIGVNNYKMNAYSCAVLTGPCKGNSIPLGISKAWYDSHKCNAPDIVQINTSNSCGGWSNLTDADSNKLYKDATCMMSCSYDRAGTDCQECIKKGYRTEMPTELTDKQSLYFKGGQDPAALQALYNLWLKNGKICSGGVCVPCCVSGSCTTTNCKWETSVVVYDDSRCTNPTVSNGPYEILTFTALSITSVVYSGSGMGVYGTIACRSTDEPGGCFNAGTVNPYPHIVK